MDTDQQSLCQEGLQHGVDIQAIVDEIRSLSDLPDLQWKVYDSSGMKAPRTGEATIFIGNRWFEDRANVDVCECSHRDDDHDVGEDRCLADGCGCEGYRAALAKMFRGQVAHEAGHILDEQDSRAREHRADQRMVSILGRDEAIATLKMNAAVLDAGDGKGKDHPSFEERIRAIEALD